MEKLPGAEDQAPTSLNVGGSDLGWPATLAGSETTSYSHCPKCGDRLFRGECSVCPWPEQKPASFRSRLRRGACRHCAGTGIVVPRWALACAWCGGLGVEAER